MEIVGSAVDEPLNTVTGLIDGFSRKSIGKKAEVVRYKTLGPTTLPAGQMKKLTAEPKGAFDELLTDRVVRYESDQPAVATVDESTGEMTAHAPGKATITATSGSATGTAAITVCLATPTGLVSWLPGDGNANDIIGVNHGTLRDGATFDAGLVGQAFSFDGTSSVVLSTPPAVPNLGSLTYDLWINVASHTNGNIGTGNGSYFVDRNGATGQLIDLKAIDDQFALQVRYDDFTGLGGPVGGVIVPGKWTHIAMVREYKAAFHLYVDGLLVASIPDNGKSLTPHTPILGHHVFPSLLGFVGLIDEFEIFDRALLGAEIKAIFDAGAAGKCKP